MSLTFTVCLRRDGGVLDVPVTVDDDGHTVEVGVVRDEQRRRIRLTAEEEARVCERARRVYGEELEPMSRALWTLPPAVLAFVAGAVLLLHLTNGA